MRKVRNRLANISTRCKGLVTDDGPSNDLPWGRFDDRTVYVVDVANVDPWARTSSSPVRCRSCASVSSTATWAWTRWWCSWTS